MNRDRDLLIEQHLALCRRAARKFVRRGGVDAADLEQIAALGLVKAAITYDSSRGVPFEAWAWSRMRSELAHFVRDHERLIRIPRTWDREAHPDAISYDAPEHVEQARTLASAGPDVAESALLSAALGSLIPPAREVLVRACAGFTTREIGEQLGLRPRRVSALRKQARATMQAAFAP